MKKGAVVSCVQVSFDSCTRFDGDSARSISKPLFVHPPAPGVEKREEGLEGSLVRFLVKMAWNARRRDTVQAAGSAIRVCGRGSGMGRPVKRAIDHGKVFEH